MEFDPSLTGMPQCHNPKVAPPSQTHLPPAGPPPPTPVPRRQLPRPCPSANSSSDTKKPKIVPWKLNDDLERKFDDHNDDDVFERRNYDRRNT
jgi:hypothetical protein